MTMYGIGHNYYLSAEVEEGMSIIIIKAIIIITIVIDISIIVIFTILPIIIITIITIFITIIILITIIANILTIIIKGNTEYKLKLTNLTEEQMKHRITQLNWRLNEGNVSFLYLRRWCDICTLTMTIWTIQGNDEAQYLIGVEDDGKQLGLSEKDLKVIHIYALVVWNILSFKVYFNVTSIDISLFASLLWYSLSNCAYLNDIRNHCATYRGWLQW